MLNKFLISSNFVFLYTSVFERLFGPRWMAAFIDEVTSILQINIYVLYAWIENVASLADIPNLLFLREIKKILPMYWWFVHSMFLNSGDDAASLLVPLKWDVFSHHCVFGVDPPASCFQLLLEHSLVDSLGNIRLLTLKRFAPVSWMRFRLLFFHRYSPVWPEIPNFVKRFRHFFARTKPGMVSLSPSESLRSKISSNLFWAS